MKFYGKEYYEAKRIIGFNEIMMNSESELIAVYNESEGDFKMLFCSDRYISKKGKYRFKRDLLKVEGFRYIYLFVEKYLYQNYYILNWIASKTEFKPDKVNESNPLKSFNVIYVGMWESDDRLIPLRFDLESIHD